MAKRVKKVAEKVAPTPPTTGLVELVRAIQWQVSGDRVSALTTKLTDEQVVLLNKIIG